MDHHPWMMDGFIYQYYYHEVSCVASIITGRKLCIIITDGLQYNIISISLTQVCQKRYLWVTTTSNPAETSKELALNDRNHMQSFE